MPYRVEGCCHVEEGSRCVLLGFESTVNYFRNSLCLMCCRMVGFETKLMEWNDVIIVQVVSLIKFL